MPNLKGMLLPTSATEPRTSTAAKALSTRTNPRPALVLRVPGIIVSLHPSSALDASIPAGGFGGVRDTHNCRVTLSLGNTLEFSALVPLFTDQT